MKLGICSYSCKHTGARVLKVDLLLQALFSERIFAFYCSGSELNSDCRVICIPCKHYRPGMFNCCPAASNLALLECIRLHPATASYIFSISLFHHRFSFTREYVRNSERTTQIVLHNTGGSWSFWSLWTACPPMKFVDFGKYYQGTITWTCPFWARFLRKPRESHIFKTINLSMKILLH